jgi:branched-chain amino acid transport system ATP-binding protein
MLRLRGIEARYAEHVVLREVTLSVPAASIVALLGPNGAGKTTLLRVASGLLRPAAGRVELDGENVTTLEPHELVARGLCHVPEGRGVFPSLSVRENLIMQASPGQQAEAIARAENAFPILGRRLDQFAGTLSGGEQRMLALARAYVQRPRLVLLDEVSLGLAPKVVEEIFSFIKRLAGEGTALLLVEQYVIRALELSNYVYMLNQGELVFAGEPAELEGEDVFRSYVGSAVGSRARAR